MNAAKNLFLMLGASLSALAALLHLGFSVLTALLLGLCVMWPFKWLIYRKHYSRRQAHVLR